MGEESSDGEDGREVDGCEIGFLDMIWILLFSISMRLSLMILGGEMGCISFIRATYLEPNK